MPDLSERAANHCVFASQQGVLESIKGVDEEVRRVKKSNDALIRGQKAQVRCNVFWFCICGCTVRGLPFSGLRVRTP